MQTQEKLHRDFADLVPSIELEWAKKTYLDALPTGSTIVEIGVGNGSLANSLNKKGHTVHGVDISSFCLEKLDTGVIRHEADVDTSELDITPGSVDTIIIFNVLEHLREPERLLAHLHTLVKPGGTLLAATPNINWFVFRLKFLFGKCPEDFHNTNHVQFWNLAHFKKIFIDSGWTIERQASSIAFPNPFFFIKNTGEGTWWKLEGKYVFLSTKYPHTLLGYEQVIIARG